MSSKKEYSLSEEAYRNKLDYIASYNKKFVRIQIQVTPEERDKIKALASEKGMSVKELILIAIRRFEEE
jgi:predicted DNA binding CopG/RHH family protein